MRFLALAICLALLLRGCAPEPAWLGNSLAIGCAIALLWLSYRAVLVGLFMWHIATTEDPFWVR